MRTILAETGNRTSIINFMIFHKKSCRFVSRRKNRIAGFALKKLEEQFPGGMNNLSAFFNWTRDRDSEYDVLKAIVQVSVL